MSLRDDKFSSLHNILRINYLGYQHNKILRFFKKMPEKFGQSEKQS